MYDTGDPEGSPPEGGDGRAGGFDEREDDAQDVGPLHRPQGQGLHQAPRKVRPHRTGKLL